MADDLLDELLDESTAKNPEFPALYESAIRRREMLRQLAVRRHERALSQTKAAAAMGTSQSAVARMEAGESDPKFSTVERYAAALGCRVEYQLVSVSTPVAKR